MPHRGDGPVPARIMLVGEAWGADEERAGTPFVGASGQELNRMLHECKITRSECFVTNLVNHRPPGNDLGAWIAMRKRDITSAHVALQDKMVLPIVVEGYKQLLFEVEQVKPSVIIAFGNTAMWAMTGKWGIVRWRGSMLSHQGITVVPTYHPAAILRQWDWRAIAMHDIKRAKRILDGFDPSPPDWHFVIQPSFGQATNVLQHLLEELELGSLWIDFDLETKYGHIDCAGLSWSRTEAISIPLISRENQAGYWSPEGETQLVYLIYRILTHRNVRVRGQNLLYDAQYTFRHWHFIPRVAQDTMISHHVAFAGLPKKLDFQASMYCDYYVQWKPVKGAWKEGG